MSKITMPTGRLSFPSIPRHEPSPLTAVIKELTLQGEFNRIHLQNAVIDTVFKATIEFKLTGKEKRNWRRMVRKYHAESRHHNPKVPRGLGHPVTMKYIGPVEHLRGLGALVYIDRKRAYAQFNDFELGVLASGWHPFSASSFEVVPRDTRWADECLRQGL